MHDTEIRQEIVDRVLARRGRYHLFDSLDPAETALVIIDMQGTFVAPDSPAEVPSSRGIVDNINQITGNNAGVVRTPPRVWDTKKRLLASIERAEELLGYVPKMPFEDGLLNTIKWFRDNWDNVKRDAEFPPGMSAALGPVCTRPEKLDRIEREKPQ